MPPLPRPATSSSWPIPSTSFADVAAEIAPAVAGKPVVDVTNRIGFGADGPEIDTELVQCRGSSPTCSPAANVVKAFNTLFAVEPGGPDHRAASSSTGSSPATTTRRRRSVLELVGSIGLHPVDVGPLVRARQLEGLAFLNITLNIVNGGSWQSGWKLVGAPEPAKAAA